MTTLENDCHEWGSDGLEKTVSNEIIFLGVQNRPVGHSLRDWLDQFDYQPPYVFAYLIEHGDGIAEEIKDTDVEELEELVVTIEERRATDGTEGKQLQCGEPIPDDSETLTDEDGS